MESLYYLEEHGLLENTGYALDHSIYVTNREAWRMLQELLPDSKRFFWIEIVSKLLISFVTHDSGLSTSR